MSTKEHIKALEKTKIALMTKPDSVFFCEIAFSLKYEWDETIPTAATDGVSMLINPAFFLNLTPDERLGLVLHESLHVAYLHLIRKGNRNPKRWNIAADHVINLVLLNRGYKLPAGALHDKQYTGMNTDQVYELLPKSTESEDTIDLLPSNMSADELEDHIEQIVVRASIRSKQENDAPGTIPGDIELFIKKLLKPELPWNLILIKYLNNFNKSDFTFKKPNRRFLPNHYLPSAFNTCLIDIAIAVDISGSVSDHEFIRFISEITSIFKMLKPKKLSLIQFDTEIQSIDEITKFRDLMQVNFHGRGGTNIQPVVQWANTNKPELLMYFTDGEFVFHSNSCKSETLWMIHNNSAFKAPYGKIIHYKIGE